MSECPEIDAIIFDFDGVLVESVSIKGDALVKLYEAEGADIQAAVLRYHEMHGGVSRYDKIRYYEETLCGRVCSEERIAELAQKFSDIVEQLVVAAPWVEGAKEFLDKYSLTIPFYVASATPDAELKRIVEARGMSGYFKGVYGAPKKKYEHIADIMVQHNYDSNRLVMIGDAIADFEAAQKTATHFVGRKLPDRASPFPEGTVLIDDLTTLDQKIRLAV